MCWSVFPSGYSCAGTKMSSTGIAYSLPGVTYADAQHVSKRLSLSPCSGGCAAVGGLAFLRKAMMGPGDSGELGMSLL